MFEFATVSLAILLYLRMFVLFPMFCFHKQFCNKYSCTYILMQWCLFTQGVFPEVVCWVKRVCVCACVCMCVCECVIKLYF